MRVRGLSPAVTSRLLSEPHPKTLVLFLCGRSSMCTVCMLFQVTRPVHFLSTTKDNAVPLEVAQYMANAVPNAKLEVIPLAGHLPHLTHPHMVAELINKHAIM